MKIQANHLAGARSNVSVLDEYATPDYCTKALIRREDFNGSIWECACGSGKMLSVINLKYPLAFGTDIQTGVDFLMAVDHVNNIITNPPYNMAVKFVNKALLLADNKVAMFLRLNFLEGQSRYDLFKSTPLKTVYVFSKIQTLSATGIEKGVTIAYAWFVWDKSYSGKPQLDWIND